MAKRQIYEYPGELLWQERELDWYLENDPDGINIAIINLHTELSHTKYDMGKPEQLLDNTYRVAIAIAATKNRDYYPIGRLLPEVYVKSSMGVAALACGCVLLSWQTNHSEYENTIKQIELIMVGMGESMMGKVKSILKRTPKEGLKTDLVPDMGLLSWNDKYWILKNVENKNELEDIIRFQRAKPMQMSFLDKFVHYHYVMANDAKFALTEEQFQTMKENVAKGLYLKKAEVELPSLPQSADASRLEAWRKECENRIRLLNEENKMLQKRCERMDVAEQIKVLHDGEQRLAQEVIDTLKAELDAKEKEIRELKDNAKTYEQMAKKAMEDKDRLDKEIEELRHNKHANKPNEKLDLSCNKADDWKKISADWIIEYGEHEPKNLEHAEGIQKMLSVYFAKGSDGKADERLNMVNRILEMGSNYEANHAPKPYPQIGMVNQLNIGNGSQNIKKIEDKTTEQ